MLCIASFFVFIFLGIFSAYYRKLAAKAWYCVGKKIRFKPCDINFSEEIKGKLFSKLILTHPKWVKFLDRWIDWFAALFVIVSVWSLFAVAMSGLNLWVYDTCDPRAAESCSLGGEACAIGTESQNVVEALFSGQIISWGWDHITMFAETVTRIPDRFTYWEPKDYIDMSVQSTYLPLRESKPYMIEVFDPGCVFCSKQLGLVLEHKKYEEYNVVYFVYPIEDSKALSGTKFQHSRYLARIVLAAQLLEKQMGDRQNDAVSLDWKVLEYLLTHVDEDGISLQEKMNLTYSEAAAKERVTEILSLLGLTQDQITTVFELAESSEVKEMLNQHKMIVEDHIRTIKIPTSMFDGRRFDRVVEQYD